MRWIIGDIHGMLKPLDALLSAVNVADPDARFYFAGDYFNRGPDSRGVLDRLLELKHAKFVRGNHDDVLDAVINGHTCCMPEAIDNPAHTLADFMPNGVAETFRSYGADRSSLATFARRPLVTRLRRLGKLLPASHRKFLRELPLVIEEDEFFVGHAMWTPLEPTKDPSLAERLQRDDVARRMLIWGRYSPQDITATKRWGRTGYFGHTPVVNYETLRPDHEPLPIIAPSMVLLDTGAFAPDGRLTAFCHESQEYLQADHEGNILTGGE